MRLYLSQPTVRKVDKFASYDGANPLKPSHPSSVDDDAPLAPACTAPPPLTEKALRQLGTIVTIVMWPRSVTESGRWGISTPTTGPAQLATVRIYRPKSRLGHNQNSLGSAVRPSGAARRRVRCNTG